MGPGHLLLSYFMLYLARTILMCIRFVLFLTVFDQNRLDSSIVRLNELRAHTQSQRIQILNWNRERVSADTSYTSQEWHVLKLESQLAALEERKA